jgi:outer membrane receptor protein involved in Fe transport
MKRKTYYQTIAGAVLLSTALTAPLGAQGTPAPAPTAPTEEAEKEEVIVLSPFEVTTEENEGYAAATTLAGNRLNTELRDVGNAVSVITPQFLKDIGATSNESLLQYTTGTEVGSIQGNFAGLGDGAQLNENDSFKNPNTNTRVRGLAAADNSRDYFLTDVPWDGYNVDRIDLQRGPNSIMFGQGSPAGLINAGTQAASFRNSAELDFRYGSHGSARGSLNINRVLLEDQLAVRIALLHDNEKFKQEPAFDKDRRVYGAVRWEPAFLKRGSARTILKANFESGQVDSNRPRTLPPYDNLTAWFLTGTYQGRRSGDGNNDGQIRPGELAPYTFQRLNKLTLNAYQAQQDNLFRANHGQNRPIINGGPFTGMLNPAFRPEVGAMAQSLGGAPWAYFGAPDQAAQWWNEEPRETYGLNSAGAIVGGVGFNFHRPVTIQSPSQWAKAAGADYSEIYKNATITDESIFDFYNNLIDGPNKKEWQDWDAYNISLAQTFFNDKVGFELTYNAETYRNGQLSFLTDTRQSIRIDMMNVHADGTQAGTGTQPNNLPFGDGTPNANVGRPFITDNGQFGNNSFLSDREGKRATAFITHDFEREGSGNVLSRILGQHTFTGLLASDERETDQRNWQRYAILDQSWLLFQGYTASSLKFDNGDLAPSAIIYLGPSLLNASSASGANLSRVTQEINMGGVYNVRAFNSRWANPAGVNPGDPWINPVFLPPEVEYATVPGYIANPNATNSSGALLYPDRRLTTQSRNPLNYIGWQNVPVTVTDSEAAPGNRDILTTSANLSRNKVESRALVWQGKLLDNALVGTYGWREDDAERWTYGQNVGGRNAPGHLDLSPAMYHLPEVVDEEIVGGARSGHNGNDGYGKLDTVTSRAYSAVAHLNELPGLTRVMEKWPVNVSLLYAHSTNFQPLANRSDLYGTPIAPPQGKTREQGILFETKDGKYTFKVNKYVTSVSNAGSSGLSNQWFISASQQWGGNWVNHFEHNWTGDNIDSAVPLTHPEYDTSSQWNYGTAAGETAEQARARENAAIAAWRAWQQSPIAQRMYDAWQIDLQRPFTPGTGGLPATAPAGFTLTEDTTSKGYEFEFSATPVRNWRLSLNASKTTATRRNVGGAALAEFIAAYETALKTTAAGDVRVWWGGAGNETTLYQWNQNVGFEWTSRKLQEGTQAPEIRKWRFNAISNYDFTEGRLRGVNVGAGVRYQDSVIIGYTPVGGSDNFSIDLNAPYTGPAETNFDFWIGYGRRLAEKIDWRIQVNVRNAFDGDGLIPITVQPDGTPAAYRIAPSQTWTLSNTFRF